MPRVLLATLTGLMLVAAAACGDATPTATDPADTGYGTLFDRLALEPGMPLLVLGDLTLAAEAADVELPAPQARDWRGDGIERLAQHPPLPASEVAVVAGDAAAQFGRAPTDDGEDIAVPAALAPQRDVVGDLAGTDRLARELEGWARGAFVVLEPHQPGYFDAVEPVGEPLEPYQHLALAAVVDEAGQRTALMVVHQDEAAARTNAERLARNLAATGHADRAEASRDGATVVVDWFREDVRSMLGALQRLDFGIVDVAVPANLVDADQ